VFPYTSRQKKCLFIAFVRKNDSIGHTIANGKQNEQQNRANREDREKGWRPAGQGGSGRKSFERFLLAVKKGLHLISGERGKLTGVKPILLFPTRSLALEGKGLLVYPLRAWEVLGGSTLYRNPMSRKGPVSYTGKN